MHSGTVAEVILDDLYQASGVLVRLEDDIIGHVTAVLPGSGRTPQQEAVTEVPADYAGVAFRGGDCDYTAVVERTGHAGEAAVAAAGSAGQLPSAAVCSTPATPQAAADTGAATEAGGVSGGAPAPDSPATAFAQDIASPSTACVQDMWRQWEALQRDLGEGLTSAVLEMCNYEIETAIQVNSLL